MGIPLFQVDAFTDRPFSGNPAAVCLVAEDRDDVWMQAVAAEMNLSETAFLRKRQDGMTAFQVSKRGGLVRVRVAGDRVALGGQAVTVMTGSILAERGER
jgi:predicted PhzF superfamily epimerase YddE/YHI9